ncbi:GNAT family N-acetyltransferase [Alteribacter aurantiacus]|uniref:GNAT family N-acetyltransferase n=1 Tax=Alteribacter aurantiacus TaxID=254410 RepID=UPI0004110B5D|nr:GNAT family N-acetyltransferase [Alteribacter aurantiacus]
MKLKNGTHIRIRSYKRTDYPAIVRLNEEQGWTNLNEREEEMKEAWDRSNVAYVAEDEGNVIGYIRGLTDFTVSLYVCEILVSKDDRGQGIGKSLLSFVHKQYPKTRLELLSTGESYDFYEKRGYQMLYGFRKSNGN